MALGRFIEDHNGVVLTNKPIVQLVIEGGKCTGVECEDGSKYRADKAVVSTIHVKHLVNMAPRELWGQDYLDELALFQPEQAMFSFHFATSEPPKYPLAAGGTISTCEAALLTSPTGFAAHLRQRPRRSKSRRSYIANRQSVCGGPDARAGGISHVKIEGTQPYALKEGPEHWDAIKDQVATAFYAHLGRFAPNLTPDKILAKFIESPLDIERMNPAMWRGSAHHGDRRIPQSAPYKMPIPGLYQTGACTPPGGSITGMPGRNTAAVILKDNGSSIEQIVGKTQSRKA